MDFNKMLKLFCESVSIGFAKHGFYFGFASGANQSAFAVPPEVAKGLVEGLAQKVAEYEKAFGPIDTSHNQVGIQSPLGR
ncbi:MAG: hypothetical protein WDN10_01425 [bacterium]